MVRVTVLTFLGLLLFQPALAQDLSFAQQERRLYADLHRAEEMIRLFDRAELRSTEEAKDLLKAVLRSLAPSKDYIHHPSQEAEFNRLRRTYAQTFVRRFVDPNDNLSSLVSSLEALIHLNFRDLSPPGVTVLNYFGELHGRPWAPWAPSYLSYFYVTERDAKGDVYFEFRVSPEIPATPNEDFNNMVMQSTGSQRDLLLWFGQRNQDFKKKWITQAEPTHPVDKLLCEISLQK